MKIYSFPITKTNYCLCYIKANSKQEAFEVWKDADTDSPEFQASIFDDGDYEISSICGANEMDEEPNPYEGIRPYSKADLIRQKIANLQKELEYIEEEESHA